MARRRKPGLTPEDREIWEKVASSVTPLDREGAPHPGRSALLSSTAANPAPPEAPAPPKPPVKPATPLPNRFRIGMAARSAPPRPDVPPSLPGQLATQPKVDGALQGRLRRGKIRPEARIDLHGMTVAEAHPALAGFLTDAHSRGRRLVLVITGKGGNGDDGGFPFPSRGVLRRQVPHWLQTGALAAIVLQISPAHIRHGGEGAYYVYLRRQR